MSYLSDSILSFLVVRDKAIANALLVSKSTPYVLFCFFTQLETVLRQ